MASALVDPKSVPESLRERVRASKASQYEYAQNRYLNSLTSDALFVGEPIKIPGGGMYEMYVVFTLNTQAETLTLIRNSLIFTGFALIFLIGLITWLVVRQVVRPVRDAARVATRFTDGEQMGFGAEIGISNQKLHARGPMGLEAMTTTTWIVTGTGQIRS